VIFTGTNSCASASASGNKFYRLKKR
jgi:hypothetical protein